MRVEVGELTGANGETHRPFRELRRDRRIGWRFQKRQQLREPVGLFLPLRCQKPTRRGSFPRLGTRLPDKQKLFQSRNEFV